MTKGCQSCAHECASWHTRPGSSFTPDQRRRAEPELRRSIEVSCRGPNVINNPIHRHLLEGPLHTHSTALHQLHLRARQKKARECGPSYKNCQGVRLALRLSRYRNSRPAPTASRLNTVPASRRSLNIAFLLPRPNHTRLKSLAIIVPRELQREDSSPTPEDSSSLTAKW